MLIEKQIHFLKTLSERQALFWLIGIAFLLRLYTVLMAQGIAYDSAAYGFMARDLMKGNVDKALEIPGHPLYPFLISLFSINTEDVEIVGRLISLFFGTLTVIPLYFLIRNAIGKKEAIFSVLFYAFHPYLVSYSGMMLTEATYWGMLVLSVYFFWTGLQRDKIWKMGLSGIFLGLAYLTRPEGIGYLAVYLAWAIIKGFRRKTGFKTLVILGILLSSTILTSFPYLLHIRHETGQWLISKKAAEVQSDLLQKDVEQVYSQEKKEGGPSPRPKEPGFLLILQNMLHRLPVLTYHYLRAFHVSLWVFLFFGLLSLKRKREAFEGFLASFVLFHLFSLSIFPFDSSIRFSIPVVSVSLCWAGSGVLELNRFLTSRKVLRPEKVIFFLIIASLLIQLPQSLKPERSHRAVQKEVGLWLKQNTPSDSIIMSNSSQETFYADREFIMLPEEINKPGASGEAYHEVMKFARAKGVRYILIDKNTSMRNRGFVESIRPEDLREVFRKPDRGLIIYEVVY